MATARDEFFSLPRRKRQRSSEKMMILSFFPYRRERKKEKQRKKKKERKKMKERERRLDRSTRAMMSF